jgi:class 3 adenylate cyclase/tetratricopeptide (TPR) repeat protein
MNTPHHSVAALTALLPRRILTAGGWTSVRAGRGVILFADIAGFTRLTETARRLYGTRGIEELTEHINCLLGGLVDASLATGGDVLKFGGDAILVAFDSTGDAHDVIHRALGAASLMRQSITRHRRGSLRSVSLHLGLAHGTWSEFVAGTPGQRREHFVWGSAISAAMAAADGTRLLPRVFCSPKLLPRDSTASIARVAPGLYEIDFRHDEARLSGPPSDDLGGDEAPLWDLLPPKLRDRQLIEQFDPARSAEHRRVATVFGFWKAPRHLGDPSQSSALLHRITELTHEASQSLDGMWVRSDPSENNQKLLVLFGATQSATDDVDRALHFAEELRLGFSSLRRNFSSLTLSIGVATATVYTGFAGNVKRREFTVMGDGVNLAARLAAKAPGNSILTDSDTLNEASQFRFRSAGTLLLKNVRKLTPVYRPTGVHHEVPNRLDHDIVDHPTAMIECLRAWAGRQAQIHLTAESGAEIRRFIEQFRERVSLDPADMKFVEFSPTDESRVGSGIQRVLRALQYENRISSAFDEERIARLLARSGTETAAHELVKQIGPLTLPFQLLVLDHLERVTALDLMVLRALTLPSDVRVVAVEHVTTSTSKSPDFKNAIQIGAVTQSELAVVLSQMLSPAIASRGLVQLLHERSQGSARVARVLMSHLIARGLARQTRGKRPIWQLPNADAIDIPNGLRAHFLQSVDRLPIDQKLVLRSLAVLGDAAMSQSVKSLCEALSSDELASCLSRLVGLGLIGRFDETAGIRYAITDPSCRQAVYETMSHQMREELHRKAAMISDDIEPAIIGEHLYRARDPECARWLVTAATRARRFWSLNRARQYLRWALLARLGIFKPNYAPICPPFPRMPSAKDTRLFESLADILRLEGQYKDARKIQHWLACVAKASARPELSGHHRLIAARLDWYAGRYVKSGQQASLILRLARRLKSKTLIAQAAFLLGETCRRTGRSDAGLKALLEAATHAEAVGNKKLLADTLNALGLLHWNCGRLTDSRTCFLRALDLFARGADSSLRGQVANNLGILHEELGQLPQAERFYERAFRVFERTGIRRHRAYSLGNLANLHRHAARYERARSAYEEVESELRAMGEAHAAAYTVGNLGDLARDFGDLETARALYDATLQFAAKSGDEELRAECLARVARVHLIEGRPDLTRRLLRSAERSARLAKSREFALYAKLLGIEVDIDRRSPTVLLERLESICEESDQVGLLYYRLWTQFARVRLEMRRGNFAAAQSQIRQGVQSSYRSGYKWWELRFAVEGTSRAFTQKIRGRCISRAVGIRDEISSGIGDAIVKTRFNDLALIQAIPKLEADVSADLPADH